MIIRINEKRSEWFWQLETPRGVIICISENWKSMDGGYSRKSTAVRAAWRFIDKYLAEMKIEIMDQFSGESLGGRNLF